MLLPAMTAIISLLRGVNVGGHNQVRMDTLRELYASIGLRDAQTYVQSGNVVCTTREKNLALLGKRIEDAIERKFKFRPEVVLRTGAQMRDVIARNPFATRRDIEPGKLLVIFLNKEPGKEIGEWALTIKAEPEEVRIDGRELYIYFPDGMGRSKVWRGVGKALQNSGTGRNWNTLTKLSEMAGKLEVAE
jgi:uncharacterized protein (DUF1697 family)